MTSPAHAIRRGLAPAAPTPSAAPTALVAGSIVSLQSGAALAATLLDRLGPAATGALRLGFAAAVLLVIWRPRPGRHTPGELALGALFGLALAGMNLCFYEALARIPLGVAVTFEFVGPLGVALVASRRRLDLLWIALAAAGIGLLCRGGLHGLDPAGVALALAAGTMWAAYIVLNRRVGRAFPRGEGLAIGMAAAALASLPFGLAAGGGVLAHPALIAPAAVVALLCSIIPYSLELEALRRIPAGTFGVLMSLEPAVAAVAGLIVLGQALSAVEVVAIALVVAASAGAARAARSRPAPTVAA